MAETAGYVGNQTIVYNHDILGLVNRLNRFITELYSSVSSGTSQMNAFDQTRLASYLDSIDSYQAWVVAQPQLDLPETSPRAYTLPASPAINPIENEEVNDLLRLIQISRYELTNAQSARDSAGLNKFDQSRLSSITTKCRNFLLNYIQKTAPLDLPESSPEMAMAPAGARGV